MSQSLENTILKPIDDHLNHYGALVDSRTDTDWMRFLSGFAKLINFFDKQNVEAGNWRPFVLKDPVFLLAELVATDVNALKNTFEKSCPISTHENKWSSVEINVVNRLFDQIDALFERMKEWSYYMLLEDTEYLAKSYLINGIQDKYAALRLTIIAWRNDLAESEKFSGMERSAVLLVDRYATAIWKGDGATQPYWEALNVEKNPINSSVTQIVNTLKGIAAELFDFLEKLIHKSQYSFTNLRRTRVNFPDTVLLRTFVELLKVNREQINGLTRKHLEFYYQDFLKQQKKPTIADQVFVSLQLSDLKSTYVLPSKSTFTAGESKLKKEILFENNTKIELNPCRINKAYTLKADDNLYLSLIKNPSTVQKSEEGSILGWASFGEETLQKSAQKVNLGLAIASPLLALAQGKRIVTFTFSWSQTVGQSILKEGKYYLSTQKSWLSVSSKITSWSFPDSSTAIMQLTLSETDPAIECFEKWPDGYKADWPTLKMIFPKVAKLKAPYAITAVEIKTQVLGLTQLSLSNDNGALNSNKPFQIFGPIANEGDGFYINNTELLSKPLDFFDIEFKWDKLPNDFSEYYHLYNLYLNGQLISLLPEKTKSFFKRIGQKISSIWKSKSTEKEAVILPNVFENKAFKLNFDWWINEKWQPLNMVQKYDCQLNTNGVFSCDDLKSNIQNQPTEACLYAEVKEKPTEESSTAPLKTLLDTSVYAYQQTVNNTKNRLDNPFLQQVQNKASKGIRLTLNKPTYGFGHNLYAKLVAEVALLNAEGVIRAENEDPVKLIPAPNVPYIPQAKSLAVNYQASQYYSFDYAKNENPIQCFHYNAFENYLVYDSSLPAEEYATQIGVQICGEQSFTQGIPLFPGLAYDAIQFLALKNVITPGKVSFYYEIGRAKKLDEEVVLTWFSLTRKGWQKLPVVADSTRNLSCSGIITFNFPENLSDTGFQMPKNDFWIAAALTGDSEAIGETYFVGSNGVQLTRILAENQKQTPEIPKISANKITAAKPALPKIAKVNQPFASFGGEAAETIPVMNTRVSERMRLKERPLSINDFNRIVRKNFKSIFYSKVNRNNESRSVCIYLIKQIESEEAQDAFTPLVSSCLEEKVQQFLNTKTAVNPLTVRNFDLDYLIVNATVYIHSNYDLDGAANRITQALKVFLSPWIQSQATQIPVDQGVSDAQIAAFMNDFEEVSGVEDISFQLADYKNGEKVYHEAQSKHIRPKSPAVLLVPNKTQKINWKRSAV